MSWSEIMTTGFTLCTLFTLVFAVMDHRWIKVETEKQTYYSGLWKVCLKLVCSGLITSAPNVHGAKTLLVMALFCGFVGASFMTFTYRYSSSFTIYRYLVAALGSFITAALVFLGLSIYTIRVSTHGVSRTSMVSYLWSFYLAWITCPFFIISGFTKASRILLTLATLVGFVAAFSLLISCQCPGHCRGPSNMLVSSAASFATGTFGFTTLALYTIDVTQRQISSVGTLHFTWSFCLSWLVFTLYVMNGFFSLLIHLMSLASRVERHMNPILLEENAGQRMAGEQAVVGLPAVPQHEILLLQENPSLPLNSTVI